MFWDWTNGWLWIAAGLLAALSELILPGYILLGSAAALVVMGVILLAGFWPFGLPAALIATGILSALAWIWLRRWLGVQKGQLRIWDRDIND